MGAAVLPVFLTAYDPTDLPGGSIDPLGFATGFNALAEELLPGMTGAASQPAYLAVLCGALRLLDRERHAQLDALPEVRRRKLRVEGALRFERAWALASVLATTDEAGAQEEVLPGVRGVTYVRKEVERIGRDGRREGGTKYPLLSRQYTYGMLGIYSGVAERLHLLERSDFSLTPSIGAELGDAFLEQTLARSRLRRGVAKLALDDEASLSLSALREWGEQARPGPAFPERLAQPLRDGLRATRRRQLMLTAMEHSAPKDGEHPGEVDALERALGAIDATEAAAGATQQESATLRAVLEAVLAFEKVYRWCMVGFERLLYLARNSGDAIEIDAAAKDDFLAGALAKVAESIGPLEQCRSALHERALDDSARRLANVVGFAGQAGRAASSREFLHVLLSRHRDVQHGKFDRGRRKLPWIERSGGLLAVTSSLAGGSNNVIETADQVEPHAWRTYAAYQFLAAVGGVQ